MRFWRRTAWVAPTAGVIALAGATLTSDGLNGAVQSAVVLHLFQCMVALVAGMTFLICWSMTGAATLAWFAVALVVGWLPQIPLLIVDDGRRQAELIGNIGLPARVVVTLAFLWFLLRAMRTTQVDSALHPVRTMLAFALATGATATGLDVARGAGILPQFGAAANNGVDVVLGALVLVVSTRFLVGSPWIPRPVSTRFAIVLVAVALSFLLRAAARVWAAPLWVVSGLVALMGLVVLTLVATSVLRSVLEFNGLRLLGLSLRADSAEEAVRYDQERLHELRSTVAGVHNASSTLHRNDGQVDPERRHRLEQMMTAELSRMQRLLDSQGGSGDPAAVRLDDVIHPIVVAHRELGTRIDWQPTGARVVVTSDRAAAVLNALLTNARCHAPGAAVDMSVHDLHDYVRVVVHDDGPGLSPDVAARAFDRGARGPESDGDGLGLYVARRLAAEQGGSLRLVGARSEQGATFVLTLRAAHDGDAGPRRRLNPNGRGVAR